MAFFLPTVSVKSILDITPQLLRAMGVNTILLDVDNTLAVHGAQEPFPGAVEWTKQISQKGFRIIILSNNFEKRVAPFAQKFSLPFLSFSMKPLPMAYTRAMRKLGARRKETVAVGDQIFTDVIGANLSGVKSILLAPDDLENTLSFRIRRALEQPIRRRAERIGRGSQYFKE
ncbi:YqeG family HAD IIIA-type phosphatase [Clostridium sp. D33t1_170424_F3]|uniref:YqeG family HAD IIIA-type phosphatase n=1 Tax=Clostridium sp. D33t1_170424_F3 TaxID=2787099 RepID=UPI0018AB5748|nr:YqeG family HAD IIIA-type phosphatase [Clostridium sp. D33t1_170424_F3]